MMARRIAAGLGLLVMLAAACTSDTVAPDAGQNTPGTGPQLTPQSDADVIKSELQCLYGASVIPNPQSTIGKLDAIVAAITATPPDLVTMTQKYTDLYNFLENWRTDSKTNGQASLTCGTLGPKVNDVFIGIELQLEALVQGYLAGDICIVPATGEKTCTDADATGKSLVYFPDEIYNQLTSVYIENNPPGLTKLQDTFDEYGTKVLVVTSGISDFSSFTNKPLVFVCYNGTVLSSPEGLLARLLLGSLHETLFKFLNPLTATELTHVPSDFCKDFAPSSVLGLSQKTPLGRLASKLALALLPKPLQAAMFATKTGAGGAATSFSSFGAVDPGLDAFGGVGGSATSFAPQALPSGPMMTNSYDPGTSTAKGQINDVGGMPNLPWVMVTTQPRVNGTGAPCNPVGFVAPNPGDQCFGDPVNGVVVKFELEPPKPATGTMSGATLCTSPVTVSTGSQGTDGRAMLPCLNYGPTIGFKNLKVTFTPPDLDPLDPNDPNACMFASDGTLDGVGACDPNTDVNFKIQTIPGDPASLDVSPPSISGAADAAFNSYVVQLKDGGSPSPNNAKTPGILVKVVPADPTNIKLSGTPCSAVNICSVATDTDGKADFTGLTVGGPVDLLNPATLDFTATDNVTNPASPVVLTGKSAKAFIIRAGTPKLIKAIIPNSDGIYAGTYEALSPISPNPTVQVTDDYANKVGDAKVTWTRTDALEGGNVVPSSTTTDANGQVFASWTLGVGTNALSVGLTDYSSVAPATFSATGKQVTLAQCLASGTQKKTDLAKYSSTAGGYVGYFSILATETGGIRWARVGMSVTGQSSTFGYYTTLLEGWVGNPSGPPIVSGRTDILDDPTTQSFSEAGTLKLPGSNSNPYGVNFKLNPTGLVATNLAGRVVAGETITFKLTVLASSQRTFQLWYNTKADTPLTNCENSKLYVPFSSITQLTGFTTRVNLITRNYQ